MSKADLARLLAGRKSLLLDFDGPVCDFYANYPATTVASELRITLLKSVAELPDSVIEESDPLEILRWTATLRNPELTRAVEDALCAAELRAVTSSYPTPYVDEVLSAARQKDCQVAIVSNNSAPAIGAYLDMRGLSRYVAVVISRVLYHPELMKPHPHPILCALAGLSTTPDKSVLVGDSLTDITAARKVGVPIIAYANKADKTVPFELAGADAVLTTMAAVADALTRA